MTEYGSAIFKNVLEAARKQLHLEFDKAKAFRHAGLRGEERAEALATFLRERLPPAFGVSTGEIIDRRDRRTGQLDLIVYDQTVTRAIHTGHKNALYPCEAVYVVIEVKSVLSKAEVETCLTAAGKVRALRPFGERFVDARTQGAPADDSAHRCMYVVFAYSSDIGEEGWLEKEYQRLQAVAGETGKKISNIDRVLVLDRGIINPSRGQGRTAEQDPGALFAEFFLHMANFVARERDRRPKLSWQSYALPRSHRWQTLRPRSKQTS